MINFIIISFFFGLGQFFMKNSMDHGFRTGGREFCGWPGIDKVRKHFGAPQDDVGPTIGTP